MKVSGTFYSSTSTLDIPIDGDFNRHTLDDEVMFFNVLSLANEHWENDSDEVMIFDEEVPDEYVVEALEELVNPVRG